LVWKSESGERAAESSWGEIMNIDDIVKDNDNTQKTLLRSALLKPAARYKFRELKVLATVSTDKRLNELMVELRSEGMKILRSRTDRTYYLSTIPTPYSDYFDMTFLPEHGRLGLISDTHLCSDADRLDLLEKIYDDFEKQGIKHVLHSGDLMDGWNVYPGHERLVKVIGGQV
jgi:calcineurin-like phosphoesterase family protein